MTSEYYEFEDGGKDNTARRTLFGTFIGMVAPPDMDKSLINIDVDQDRHFVGFRKSAGVWYKPLKSEPECWDRRLVLWMRAQSGKFLPFYDKKGEPVSVQGKRLEEAAVCTLEVVLRNTATYSIGFLLLPKYKKRQEECISKACSWMVIGYFPFPKGPAGSVYEVRDCETDPEKVNALLLQHKPHHLTKSSRVAARNGDFKPSHSLVARKRLYSSSSDNQKKRRIDQEIVEDNTDMTKPLVATSQSTSQSAGSEIKEEEEEEECRSMKHEECETSSSMMMDGEKNKNLNPVEDFERNFDCFGVPFTTYPDVKKEDSYLLHDNMDDCLMLCEDVKCDDTYVPIEPFEGFFNATEQLSLFPNSCTENVQNSQAATSSTAANPSSPSLFFTPEPSDCSSICTEQSMAFSPVTDIPFSNVFNFNF